MDKLLAIGLDVLNVIRGKGSWKTGAAGIVAGVVVLLTQVVAPLVDSDPATGVKWVEAITGVAIALGLYSARDDDKSSEDVGTK